MDAREQACAFCEIAAGTGGARVVYEDAHTLAFFPLAPATRGHTLVVPRAHSADLWAMDETAAQHLFRTVLLVGGALRAVLRPDGMNVINSAGAAASQSVFHTHVHLVPRRPGDPMGPIWPPKGAGFRDEEDPAADALAARVRAAIGRPGR
ncbi:HIT family protein [Streptomyces viridochromogenes]|uniref:Putative HIT family hydrolase, diadenosine tetraphosphate hydrolase n=1 Tax=Streptomyces viridochromogenes Tue57 TaxID=1160705 RepID=L8PCS7_STRVR|nr:HIT family protein [Streptomyces viridochromogenes]ELS53943.1 putative HIT family hydrolase, diadenosine tetraphosphate hydrolase [Streptomyces viridochromogenes Tue57]